MGVFDLYKGPADTYSEVAENDTTLEPLIIRPGGEFTITVIDNAVRLLDDYSMGVRFDNGTHFVTTDNYLRPGLHYISFIDWDYWTFNMTADPFTYFGGLFTIENLIVQNGVSEVRINVTMALEINATATAYIDQSIRYDKASGVANNVGIQTRDFDLIGGSDIGFGMRLKGYDLNTPFEPLTTTTTTVTSTASNTTTSVPIITTTTTTTTSDTNTGTVTTTTTTSTAVTSSSSATTSSSTNTATTTTSTFSTSDTTSTFSTSDTTNTVSDTMTSDTSVTDTSSDTNTFSTTTTMNSNDPIGGTEDPVTSRQLTSETKETTLVRTNSTSETTESPTSTIPVPAFGPIMTFTGFMVTLMIIRKKN